ncbi:Methanol dehydrogenase activator [Calidithermus terrae]|uniref:Methanol dehydrogenase activator n=1 Tax=Calidithermus terrae TaxID=1408545 RepID=A0A399F339_9DEIN|nr:NUDIX hydrolase [Calidithermus terrae]RIH90195.1 Methanol dehydrogenase activator [Calidithermus terrae]
MPLPDPEPSPWQTLSSELVYENRWIAVTHRRVINPSGNPGVYGVVHFKNRAIGVLPLDDEGNTYLVGQYRYTLQRYSWEIPEGGGPLEEEPLEAAKRELLEETGLRADRWELLLTLHLSNSVTDEVGLIYLARGLHQGEASPEDTEDLRVQKVPLEEVYRRVLAGEITDSLTVAAVLRARLWLLEQGRP